MNLSNRQAKTLKEALHDTIHRHEYLSVEAIAEQLNMAPSYLYRSALPDPDTDGPNASGCRFPLKQLAPLIRLTGDFQVLDAIEFTLGRVGVPIPKHDKHAPGDAQNKAIDAVVKFGELIKTFQQSIIDDKISREEQQQLERDGSQAIQAIMILLSNKVK